MCELEDQAMRDAVAQARSMKKTMDSIDAFFGPSLQRARELADKIHAAAEACREADATECQPDAQR